MGTKNGNRYWKLPVIILISGVVLIGLGFWAAALGYIAIPILYDIGFASILIGLALLPIGLIAFLISYFIHRYKKQ